MNLLLLLKKVACAIAEMPFSLCKSKKSGSMHDTTGKE